MLYGLTDRTHLVPMIAAICDTLGDFSDYQPFRACPPAMLVLETAAHETDLGRFADHGLYSAGVGLCQFDPIGFADVVQRTPLALKRRVRDTFGVDLGQLQHRDLAFSPLLSLLFCRLFYRLKPGRIPDTLDGRAAYWKRWYNTAEGKGTEAEFIADARRLVPALIGAYPP